MSGLAGRSRDGHAVDGHAVDGRPADGRAGDGGGVAPHRLDYQPPYDWASLLGFLRQHALPGIERCDAGSYRRTLVLARDGEDACAGWFSVSHDHVRSCLWVELSSSFEPRTTEVLARVRSQFDIDRDPYEVASVLGSLAVDRPGLRVPGSADGFDQAVRTILGQRVTLAAGCTLARRFNERFATLTHYAARPQTIAALDDAGLETIGRLGILRAQARAIVALARAMTEGDLDLSPGADPQAAIAALLRLPGVGPWTAQTLAMRALGWADAFPPGDVAILRMLDVKQDRDAQRLAEAWRPWRSYAVMHLWHRYLERGSVRAPRAR